VEVEQEEKSRRINSLQKDKADNSLGYRRECNGGAMERGTKKEAVTVIQTDMPAYPAKEKGVLWQIKKK